MATFSLVSAYATSDTPFFVSGANNPLNLPPLNEAPQQIKLQFSPGTVLDQSTLAGGISVVRSGGANDPFGNGNDITVTPGSLTVGDSPNQNQVVIRFAETLPDDTYQIRISGALKSTTGDTSNASTLEVRLDLGAFVVSVVPQPVSRSGSDLTQDRNSIVVYFNQNDPLNVASAQTVASYRLFEVDAAGKDVSPLAPANPTSVAYDFATGKAVLNFAAGVIADGKLYRVEVGGAEALVSPATPTTEGSDDNSSFVTARNLGALSAQGAMVTGSISAPRKNNPDPALQGTLATPAGPLQFPTQPGSYDEPGHRQEDVIAIDSHYYGLPEWMTLPATGGFVGYYNFQKAIGVDGQGNTLYNAITDEQKQRCREVLELFSRYTGLRFVETPDDNPLGLTIATGDTRALSPTTPPNAVAGIGSPVKAIMSSLVDWGKSEYAGQYFQVAMHEIGHSMRLAHSYDLPSIMGAGLTGEAVFPGDYDTINLAQLYPAESTDVDLYKFALAAAGTFSAQTVIARPGQAALSPLDSVISLYREDTVEGKAVRTLIARNDDSFGRDSFVGMELQPGTYFVGVSSSGNDKFNPEVSDSGYGGRSYGDYQLKLGFQPRSSKDTTITDASGTLLDGDRDGTPGGAFKFWFNTASQANTIFVDKAAYANLAAATAAGANGTLAKPYFRIQDAVAAATAGSIIRIVGNAAGTPYLVGNDLAGRPLADGQTFNVPANVTVMIDEGAVFKLRGANIDVGSASPLVSRGGASLQVLGTPGNKVTFTSFHDDSIGGNSDGVGPAAVGGQWGGLVLRQDSDAASKMAFVNTVEQAVIRYAGGQVVVDSKADTFAPIQLEHTRPTIAFNTITNSAGAAIAADPDSFEETSNRVGPELRGNRLVDNTTNGLFVKIRTQFGSPVDRLDVPARFKSTDIVYVLQENLFIAGGVGGYQLVGGNVQARQSGRLTIDPGVVVKMLGSRIELERGTSQLIAEGTAAKPVIFTSLGDVRYGAGGTFDTNGNQPNVRAAGDWGGIVLDAGSKASIDHAYIAYGGGQTPIEGSFDNFNVIETHQGDLRVAHSRIENNAVGTATTNRVGRGFNAAATIFVRGAQPVIFGNDFRNNLGAVVSVNANSLSDVGRPDPGRSTGPIDREGRYDYNRGPLVGDNRLSYTIDAAAGRPAGGATLGMEVRGEEVTVESVWDDVSIVHVLRNEVIVQNFSTATGVRLVSQPDASLIVKLQGANAGFTAAGYGLDITDRIGGTVQAIGQPGFPVVLTSLKDDSVGASLDPLGRPTNDTNADGGASTAAPGDWRSLKFLSMSNDRNVSVVQESEKPLTGGLDMNYFPATAQPLGVLAPDEKSGDENRRLGFEVHGNIAPDDSTDVDVYSFQAYAGSLAWLDIDKSNPALDSMIELLDASGKVLARSADSQTDGSLLAGTRGIGQDLQKDATLGGDYYTVNPKDSGMRVVLPSPNGQPVGTLAQYYVRVRSQPRYEPATTGADNGNVVATSKETYEDDLADAAKVKSGATSGAYELRVRLRQQDEKPGSTVRYADIRYPTIGIDVQGLPNHSPLTGTTGEATTANDTFATAQYVGNVLQSDQSTISVAGEISSATDVDWYSVALNLEQIQAISGVDGLKSWATVFDIDYADGFRGDLTLSVFDSNGNLIFVGRDSNVASDQPAAGQGTGFSDLSRGTAGKLDPFIGPAMLPAGLPTGGGSVESGTPVTPADPSKQLRYYVAVSSNQRLPAALDAYFNQAATNSKIRLEPIDTVRRVAEDHIGVSGFKSGPDQQPNFPVDVQPATDLFNTKNTQGLSLNVTPFTLSDVTLFVYTGTTVETVDAMRGGSETVLRRLAVLPDKNSGDIAMRSDGKLYQYVGSGNAGVLNTVDTVTGGATLVGDDNIPVVPPAPAPAQGQETLKPAELGGTKSTFQLANSGLARATVNGTIRYTDTTGGVGGSTVVYSWSFTSDAAGKLTFTNVPTPAPPGGFATPQNTTSTVTAGSVTGATVVNGVATINWSSAIDMTKVDMSIQYTYSTLAPIDNNAITTDSVDALTFVRVPGQATSYQLYYSVREGGQSRLYQGNVSTGDAAASRVGTDVIGGGSLGIVTGMAAVGGTMYGVDTNGNFFRFFPDGKGGQTTGTAIIATVPGVQFQGLTLGPQNLQNGAFANMLFAIDANGDLRAFDAATGTLQAVFDSNGDGVADATSIASGATGSVVLGLAFSPLDVNLWHPTIKRGTDSGHGTNIAPDNTRNTVDDTNQDLWQQLTDGQGNVRKGAYDLGAASMYFGLEQYQKPAGTNLTPYFNYQSYDGQFGVVDGNWQKDLTTQAGVGGTYNLPGGAYGSLITNTFSLSGSTSNDKPTLYFSYYLQTEKAASDYDKNDMRDSARVFISVGGGAWQVVASNNSTRSAVYTDKGELPNFVSASSAIANIPNQHVQELYDTSEWRQARIDLGNWAGSSNIRLRFDFSTAGEFDPTQRDASKKLLNDIAGYAGTTGRFSGNENSGAATRGAKNNFEGFYVDDVIIGYAGRGEMVTGATPAQTGFFDIFTPAAKYPTIAEQSLTGPYQLEIRRGTATGVQPVRNLPDVAIDPSLQFDSNADLSGADAGDTNTVRDQGEFLIENNMILAAATYGISIDAAARDPYTNAPVPGTPRNLPVLNKNGLVPGAVIANNVISTSGTAGILFSGDAGGGTGPAAAAAFGRIVNNTIYGGKNYAAGVSLAATTVSGQPTVTVPATSGVRVGMDVTGVGIPAGTKVLSIDSGTGITLSQSATAASTGVSLAFAFTTVGVAVTDNAAPTLLNNLIANVATGISVDASSQSAGAGDGRTVIGIEAYYNVGTQLTAGVVQSQPVVLDTDPFVNAAAGNFYLNAGSRAIDSSLNSLVDRAGFVAVKSAVGIPASPILAPDRDFYNQLRVDDPTQASLPGLGSNVFKDLGAIDRADVWQPYLAILQPLDGSLTSPVDRDPLSDSVLLAKNDAQGITQFVLQLADKGVGIDQATVVKGAFTLTRNGVPLTEGSDYFFRYFSNNNRVVFEAPSVFVVGSYVITATTRATAGSTPGLLADLANNTLLPNKNDGTTSFQISLADVPGVPAGLTAVAGDTQATLTWTAATPNGSPVTDHVIEYSTDGGVNWTTFAHADAITGTTATVTGLTNGQAYVFRVTAVNKVGIGQPSAISAAVTPFAKASAPQSLVATAGRGQAVLTWAAPLSDGGAAITDYVVRYGTDGVNWTTFNDPVTAVTGVTVTPLTNGTPYYFQVAAKTTFGEGVPATTSITVTPVAEPDAPTGVVGVRADGSVSLTWNVPADGGLAISDYVIEYRTDDPGSLWVPFTDDVSATAATTVNGLTNGTAYRFRVAATNSFGTGSFSAESAPVTPLAPASAPLVTGVVGGDARATLSWSTPADNGSAITSYVIQYSIDGGANWTPAVGIAAAGSPADVTGLTNGQSYVFRVAAVTGYGTGIYSDATSAVTPIGPAFAPTATAVHGDSQATVSWTTPNANGSPIAGYVVRFSSDAGLSWSSIPVGVVNATTVTGLVNGLSYVFQVAAATDFGTGTFSASTTAVTPLGPAVAPSVIGATASDSQVTLSWQTPDGNGAAISGYVVQYSSDGGANWTAVNVGNTNAATISGLVNGVSYIFQLAANTDYGTGIFSTPTAAVTPLGLPGIPTALAVTGGDRSATLSWTAPAKDGGRPVIDYVVQYKPLNSLTWLTLPHAPSTATRATVSGLVNGTSYVFKVAAVTSVGTGPFTSDSAPVAPQSLADAPTRPSATATNGVVTLVWTAPRSKPGVVITDYRVQYSINSGATWTTVNDGVSTNARATLYGLPLGKTYIFRVAAISGGGVGADSLSTRAVVVYSRTALPAAPTAVVGTGFGGTVSLSWNASPDNEGGPVSDYVIQYRLSTSSRWLTYSDGVSTANSATIRRLMAGQTYSFRVAAKNLAGQGLFSAESAVIRA